MGLKEGGDNMRDDRTYIAEPYMSRSPKGQKGERDGNSGCIQP